MDIVSYRESKFFRHDYQAIYLDMLKPASYKTYESFEEFACDVEDFLITQLLENDLDFFRYPDSYPIFRVEPEFIPVYIPKSPNVNQTTINPLLIEPFMLGKITSIYPCSHNEKPSGIIFKEDYSFLQIEYTVAHNLLNKKMYLVNYSYHYGRIKNQEERYYFRYDMESDYQFDSSSVINRVEHKPTIHFHGNSDDPHFTDTYLSWDKKIKSIIEILRINIPRLKSKYLICDEITM